MSLSEDFVQIGEMHSLRATPRAPLNLRDASGPASVPYVAHLIPLHLPMVSFPTDGAEPQRRFRPLVE
jgi:hypothetical protein